MSFGSALRSPVAPGEETAKRQRASERSWLLFDPLLAIAALGLVGCSIFVINGVTQNDIEGSPYFFTMRQSIYVAVGLVLALLVARFDYSRLRELKILIYGSLISSIVLVLLVGGATRGSRRWIDLPFFRVQPSELGKVLLIIALSAFIVDRSRWLQERSNTARIMLLALLPAALVMAQPDLGTGLVYVVVVVTLLFIAGTSWKHLTALFALFVVSAAMVLVAGPAVGINALKPYQVERLTGFLSPSSDPGNQTYQINQSLIAIGAGGKTGRGVDKSTQTGLDFLPERHTDFIFSVVGETYGFAGAALILSLYALLIWRAIRILTVAKNLFGALIAGGIIAMLMFQVFVNVGMTIGIMPVTGVPLPLLSYGGSSMLITSIAIGLLQSIHIQARIAAAGKARGPLV